MKGIENVSPVAEFLGTFVSSIATIDKNKDGKISTLEILNTTQMVAIQGFGISSQVDWKEFREELKDLDPEEVKLVVSHYADTFDLENDQLEWLIEDYLRVLGDFYSVVNRTIDMRDAKKAAINLTKK